MCRLHSKWMKTNLSNFLWSLYSCDFITLQQTLYTDMTCLNSWHQKWWTLTCNDNLIVEQEHSFYSHYSYTIDQTENEPTVTIIKLCSNSFFLQSRGLQIISSKLLHTNWLINCRVRLENLVGVKCMILWY